MRDLAALADANVLYLTTTGRHSGLPRTIEIWFTSYAGKLYLNAERRLAAQWVLNIVQEPCVCVRLKEHVFEGRARVLDGHHDRALWQTVAELLQKYDWGRITEISVTKMPLTFAPRYR
jgi:deazaflavin-dependent oxidoreductase (nitroreductase family)